MVGRCVFHPGRDASASAAGKSYCSKCEEAQKAARALIDAHVKPKNCFIVYRGGDSWARILGTGCAHFVAHEKNLRAPSGVEGCMEGFLIRVPDLLPGRTEIRELSAVEPGDSYVTPDRKHCGVVRTNIPGSGRGRRRIMIERASSAHHGVLTGTSLSIFVGRGAFLDRITHALRR